MKAGALSSVVVASGRPFAIFLVYFFVKKYTKETRGALSNALPPRPHCESVVRFCSVLVLRVPATIPAAAGFAQKKGSPVQGELSSDNETEGL